MAEFLKLIVVLLTVLALLDAAYKFYRRRTFEAAIELALVGLVWFFLWISRVVILQVG